MLLTSPSRPAGPPSDGPVFPRTPRSRSAFALVSASTLLFLTASCEPPGPGEASSQQTISAPIIGGEPSGDGDNGVVLLYTEEHDCTGVLVAPNLVLTARHCVANLDPSFIFCDPTDPDKLVAPVQSYVDPTTVRVYVGALRTQSTDVPAARGAKLFASASLNTCGHDVAALILDTDITSAEPLPLALDREPSVGDTLQVYGFGVTDGKGAPSPQRRTRATRVLAVGPSYFEPPGYPPRPVGVNTFVLTEGQCSGDSGGPAVDLATGAVLGIQSFGAHPDPSISTNHSLSRPFRFCEGGIAFSISLPAHREFILRAFAEAGYAPWLEGQVRPRDSGDLCAVDSDCRTTACGTQKVCVRRCSVNVACADGLTCTSAGVCETPATPNPDKAGCSLVAPGSGMSYLPGFGAALAWAVGRRARRARYGRNQPTS